MIIQTLIRGRQVRRKAQLIRACETRLAQTLAPHAERLERVQIRLSQTSDREQRFALVIVLHPRAGSPIFVRCAGPRPVAAVREGALCARLRLEQGKQRRRAQTRRANRRAEARRWAA